MIAIVTDSSAYLTRAEARILGARVVPMSYTCNGRPYAETYSDHNGEYRQIISDPTSLLTTSQPSSAAFASTFDELMRKGFSILCITISSRLSGTYSSASAAAREVSGGNGGILVLDSLSSAGGIYFLIKKARELIDNGLELAQVAAELELVREQIGMVFSVEDMQPLRKSGRLGIVRQSVGTVLNLRPILMCTDGAVVSAGIARGRNEQSRRMLEKVPDGAGQVVIHSISYSLSLQRLQTEVAERFPNIKIESRILGPVLGIHLGVSVVGIAWAI